MDRKVSELEEKLNEEKKKTIDCQSELQRKEIQLHEEQVKCQVGIIHI